MRRKAIGDFQFYFKQNSVVMGYHDQYTAFHLFDARNKTPLKKFAKRVFNSKKMDINKIYGLKNEFGIDAVRVQKSSIEVVQTTSHRHNTNRLLQ